LFPSRPARVPETNLCGGAVYRGGSQMRDPADEPSTRQMEADEHRRQQPAAVLELHPLDASVRQRYLLVWHELQTGFVDDPPETVRKAVDLIRRAMRDRGYPPVDFEVRLGHPRDTEQLRQVFVHYRVLFEELLERDRVTSP
jgi:hypothetical protein